MHQYDELRYKEVILNLWLFLLSGSVSVLGSLQALLVQQEVSQGATAGISMASQRPGSFFRRTAPSSREYSVWTRR